MVALIPDSIADVTPAWLEDAMRVEGVIGPEVSVTGMLVEELGEGVGMLGDLARVTVEYDPPAAGPRDVVVKVPTAAELNRQRGMAFGFYEREAHFYRLIGNAGRTGGLRVPRCFASPMDVGAQRFALVLEDLSGSFRAPDQVAGLQVDDARRAIVALARFHAAWWERPELDSMSWLPPSNGPITKQAGPVYRQAWPVFVERFGDLIPEGGHAVGAAVAPCFERLLDEGAVGPHSIIHTDFRLDNLFFDGPDGEVALIDWQLMTRGVCAYDVSYLLGQSMERSLRREHEEDLLRVWHGELEANGVTGYGFDDAWRDYRRSALVNLVIPVALAELDHGNERGVQLVRMLSDRAFGAAVELDAIELLPG
jgi:aminoglycoside phosphotransferase (APT) family kinase protein